MSTVISSLKVPADKFYVTADPHYSHVNICRGTSKWADSHAKRDFDTVPDMNSAIVNGINQVVPHDGVLFCLGDWSFGGRDQIERWKTTKVGAIVREE